MLDVGLSTKLWTPARDIGQLMKDMMCDNQLIGIDNFVNIMQGSENTGNDCNLKDVLKGDFPDKSAAQPYRSMLSAFIKMISKMISK